MRHTSGIIFNIERGSLHDGPGIRTTVFLKGCPLKCAWCHNPESQSPKFEYAVKIDQCKVCNEVCPYGIRKENLSELKILLDRMNEMPGADLGLCPRQSLICYGQVAEVPFVMDIIRKDMTYYRNSLGGVTFSGGEPLSQPEFLYELCTTAKKENIHVSVDTSGYGSSDFLTKLLPYVDLFLFDYKLTSEEEHLKYTGVSNRLIRKNLQLLHDSKKEIWMRCPIIPGMNDSEKHFKGIADLEKHFPNISRIELMPFHVLGRHKTAGLGRTDLTADTIVPDKENISEWKRKIQAYGAEKLV
jgi:pyruvate formate lyase activating enzyme